MKKSLLPESKSPLNIANNNVLSFPIVGIGASAGGLEAFSQLFQELPMDTGMAFVLIQHLDPSHKSFLSEAIMKMTKMPVHEIQDGTEIMKNNIYVISPNSYIGISKGIFHLLPRNETYGKPNLPIDHFFRSLAADTKQRAIGVVLSGTATDGTEGLRAIKNEDGVTFVQDPHSAKFEGMPQSAVNAGVVDFCLSISKLAEELVRLSHHPYYEPKNTEELEDQDNTPGFQKILALIKQTLSVDFNEYKTATIKRRITRRMVLLGLETSADYIKLLQNNSSEIQSLYEDILIHVTTFFREPDTFKELQEHVFPEIMRHKPSGIPVRIWVSGCSSGEEVYSLAISFLEYLENNQIKTAIQIFGSDISERMIEKARNSCYPESSVRHISTERLRRFFVKIEGGYRISKFVRDLCVFVRHDLAHDPPFSKLDLISCRNVLIYFEQPLQKRILSIYHYCLNQPGFLLLGKTEGVSSNPQLFSSFNKVNKIYSRTAFTSQLRFPAFRKTQPFEPRLDERLFPEINPSFNISRHIDNLLLTQYAPCGVLINDRMEVQQYRGRTSPFLEQPSGQPELNLLKMVREGLFVELKMAIVQAKKENVLIRKNGIHVKQNDSTGVFCNVVVMPVTGLPESKESLFVVLFEHVGIAPPLLDTKAQSEEDKSRTLKLEQELKATRDYLQSLNEEHDYTNDALSTANEELVSGNEELQSMNEELETAKEELQSSNEELTTVNDELHIRNQDMNQVNNDLINLMNSVEIPILILDEHRRIRRFTLHARNIMNLLPTDIGRCIDDIKPNVTVKNLNQQIKDVIDNDTIKESEVQDDQNRWHRIQIRPYKTLDNKIDGVVLSLIDINLLKRAANNAEWARDYAKNIVEAVQTPLVVLDQKFKVISANKAFYSLFGVSKIETENQSLYDLGIGQWNILSLRTSLGEILEKNAQFQNIEVEREFPRLGRRFISLSAQQVHSHTDIPHILLLAMEDITSRKNIEKDLAKLLLETQEAKAQAEEANRTKDLFLATLSHELRTPLTSLILQTQLLRRGKFDEAKVKHASESIERSALTQARLIEDLLDISRISTGKLKMEQQVVNLVEVIERAKDTVRALAERKSVVIENDFDSIGNITGDSVRLQQVIWNLLTNAIKFSPRNTKILIKLKTVGNCAQIEVIDHGIGIEADLLPQIFTRFMQIEGSMTRTHGGLGLGLAIVRHIVEMHGGTIHAESPGKNLGTSFILSLPLMSIAIKSSSSGKERLKKIDPLSKLKGLRILVVDDDGETREALSELLKQTGANVRTASSAKEGMQTFLEFKPEELICDIAMPEEDGYTFLRKVRKLGIEKGGNIPALALTALASEADRQLAFSAGFQMHLSKPVDFNRLTEALVALGEMKFSWLV